MGNPRIARKACAVVCDGPGCNAAGSQEIGAAFRRAIDRAGCPDKLDVRLTGCLGLCEAGPVVLILPDGIFYRQVSPSDVEDIVSHTVNGTGPVQRLLYTDPVTGQCVPCNKDIPFYSRQERRLLENNAYVQPGSIQDYTAVDGYSALAKALTQMTPEQVIEEVTQAQIRGRGGAGFPTGIKWGLCRRSPDDEKYIICNADEGDPGAYMDRALLEGTPHSVIEGMIIGGYAIGASHGIIYCRAEYPIAVRNATRAIEQAEQYGLLGQNILGSGFHFELTVKTGAGAFVCGEETALIASLEDQMGTPRPRPPFPAQSGLWGKPTNINNVETWANVSLALRRGAEWYASVGTEKSKGTKVFSLVGKVRNTGLVEVPMGISLRELVFDIGGGPLPGRKIKAVQIGGPSGGCIPAHLFDLPVDYESLTQAGVIMGSGGLIVIDDATCMVDIAKYFLSFLAEESCGKCVPCREGIPRMLDILTAICEGRGDERDLVLLAQLGRVVKHASLCGLGQTAPNPLLSSLRYFQEEYEAHIREHRCPAGVCRALIHYEIDPETCTGCGLCMKECPQDAISGERKQPHQIDQDKCVMCGLCFDVCQCSAVVRA
ncbi:MAG: NADH-quinone oxidoreductase subunit NuoF [Phycisphaerae bacterium]|nr:NADH-quinone oxidoreductase subunit NuoF [Phycisphaerae bacterium]